jgi:hypothetical protein
LLVGVAQGRTSPGTGSGSLLIVWMRTRSEPAAELSNEYSFTGGVKIP